MEKYIPHFVAFLWVFGFFAIVFFLGRLVRPQRLRPSERQRAHRLDETRSFLPRYEGRFRVYVVVQGIFVMAVLFVVPTVVYFIHAPDPAQMKIMFVYFIILSTAFGFLWKKGDLNWPKQKEE